MADSRANHKRTMSIGGIAHHRESSTLFDYFLVVGLKPDAGKDQLNKPQILYKFPPSDGALPFEILPFCFPDGVKTHTIRKTPSLTDINRVLFGQLSALEKSSNSFIFLITSEKHIYYGVCVSNEELLESCPSVARSTTQSTQLSLSKVSRTTHRVYCFLTKFPFFKLHYDVLYSILARERLYKIEETNFEDPAHTSAVSDKRGSILLLKESGINENNEIIMLLKSYLSQPVPYAGERLAFRLTGEVHEVEFHSPVGDDDSLVTDWCLPSCFASLSLDTILTMLHWALLEKHVIIVCSNIGVLTSIVLSIIPLLRPFVWQCPLIPVLPVQLQEYLHAPVPFVVGVLKLEQSFEKDMDALVIRVDDETIAIPKKAQIPILPNLKKLVGILKPFHAQIHGGRSRFHDPYKTTNEERATCRKAMIEIKNYHYANLEMILPSVDLAADQDDLETQKGNLTKNVPRKFKPFFRDFCSTQQFIMYLAEVLKTAQEQKHNTENLFDEFNKKIANLEQEKKKAYETIQECYKKIKDCSDRIVVLREQQRHVTAPNKRQLITHSLEYLSKSYKSLKEKSNK